MNALLVLSRALHFGAALLLFGGFLLSLAVVDPAMRAGEPVTTDIRERVGRFLRIAAWWALGVALLSGLVWLIVEAALISRRPIAEASGGDTLWLVLTGTVFGRVWIARFALIVALGVLLFAGGSTTRDPSRMRTWLALGVAAGLLASLALVGHLASERGPERYVRVAVDVAHLVAAGAWLGALPGLAVLLGSALRTSNAVAVGVAARAARRFSTLGITSVGVLLVSGVANAWFLVGSVPALVGTPYGRLLLAKIALFATMVALAAINRWRLTPRVDAGDVSALRMLTRNAVLETVAGVAVVAIVGALGVAVPAAHRSPVWPFAFTLSLEPAESSAGARWMLGTCIVVLGVIAVAYLRRRRQRTGPQLAIACGAAAIVALLAASLLAVPAYPTTYAPSPVKYTTAAIAAGALTYAADCALCHGLHGRGDGPLAARLTVKPVDLVAHEAHHRAGELFWRIAHGIPDTPMPAFSPQLDNAAIWALVQYLRALAEADSACALTSDVEPFVPIAAPDFTFEDASHAQETLKQLRGREVLLVLAPMPESLPRLREIEAGRRELEGAGIRVVVVATGAEAAADSAASGIPAQAVVGPDVPAAYAMFACSGAGEGTRFPSRHVEWLIDRSGYLRARWLGSNTGANRSREIVGGAHGLRQEPPRPPAPEEHGH